MRKVILAGSLLVTAVTVWTLPSNAGAGLDSRPFRSAPGTVSSRLASVSLSALSTDAQARISGVLGRDDAEYHALARGEGFLVENANHKFAADFTQRGIDVRAGTATWSLALRGYGRGSELRAVAAIAPQASANRIEYRRGALTEWLWLPKTQSGEDDKH